MYELDTDDIQGVVQGGTGLAFVSYPDAISKFDAVPQVSYISFTSGLWYHSLRLVQLPLMFTILKKKTELFFPPLLYMYIACFGLTGHLQVFKLVFQGNSYRHRFPCCSHARFRFVRNMHS
jgi:hypothetical protein